MTRLAIDGSRLRSGGGTSHLAGMLGAAEPKRHGIAEVHVWSHSRLLAALPDRPWLFHHNPPALESNMAAQLAWQRWKFPREIREAGCDILLNADAGTVARFSPAVTMSRNMLPFDPPERSRYKYGRTWLRLMALEPLHRRSLQHSEGTIFLTHHAAETIMKSTGPLPNHAVIPHGVREEFRAIHISRDGSADRTRAVKCLYVSNAEAYKHQCQVVRAIALLRKDGLPVTLELVGAGTGPAVSWLQAELDRSDPRREFVTATGFVAPDSLPSKLAAADIFVFASSCENMPNTLLEGMAAGMPIACSDRGPMPQVLQDGGLYFDPEDASSIAATIRQLVEDPELRDELAARARHYASEYSWQRCADETLSFLMNTYSNWKTEPRPNL